MRSPQFAAARGTGGARRGLAFYQVVLLLLAIGVAVWFVARLSARRRTVAVTTGRTTVTGSGGPLDMPVKPVPAETTFLGCPPEGDRPPMGEFNRLKNRIDEGPYRPVPFDTILQLPWPRSLDNVGARRVWSRADRAAVGRYEGIPISVEGYVAGAKVSGPESPNCHGADPEMQDWHVWLSGSPGPDRTRSVVVETTPRVRARHPEWTVALLRRAGRDSVRVRIGGWLLLDPEHPEELGHTRGTLWEIHPVLRIEVQREGVWVPLESLRAAAREGRHRRPR